MTHENTIQKEARELLRKYWKHETFRTPQAEVISCVLQGRDALALLPTGGGKSVCFQIPALLQPGLCLVISPLIALMKDQVQNLEQKGLQAISLAGPLCEDRLSDLLDNCVFGPYKFLYLSPERLQVSWIMDRLRKLPIHLIAVDEAHCISQWGHDFRPAYLKISELKTHFPEVPFLALTASATPRVQQDILTHLRLKNPAVFTGTFARKNLEYRIEHTQDKHYSCVQILQKHRGSAIIYVRTRRACLEMSSRLQADGLLTTYYHGGLSSADKQKNMDLWLQDKVQVMVATNAFGMGIDKPDVRTVIHLQLPENLENYYQESGRAGRDGQRAYGVLLLGPDDIGRSRAQFLSGLPTKTFLKTVYVKLCNYFQIAYGEGFLSEHSLDFNRFCEHYQLPVTMAYNAMQFLDRQGVISLSQEFSKKVTAQFLWPSQEVVRYASMYPKAQGVLTALLRTYPGIYEYPVALNLALVANKSGESEKTITQWLSEWQTKEMVAYSAKSNDTRIVFNEVREDAYTINRISKYLEAQNNLKTHQFERVVLFATQQDRCKSRELLEYFGQKTPDCGICSGCSGNLKNDGTLDKRLLEILQNGPADSRTLQQQTQAETQTLLHAIEEMLERGSIRLQPNNQYRLK